MAKKTWNTNSPAAEVGSPLNGRRDRAELISARTKEALRARRASGLPVGRSKGPGKSKLDKHRPEIEALLANGSTQKFIAKRYNSSPANLAN